MIHREGGQLCPRVQAAEDRTAWRGRVGEKQLRESKEATAGGPARERPPRRAGERHPQRSE